jgi:lysine 2,3-aminomutase
MNQESGSSEETATEPPSTEEWNNWKWQFKNRLKTIKELEKILNLNESEKQALTKQNLPIAITPYYASLMSNDDDNNPIRKCVVPQIYETITSPEEAKDPLGEDHQNPVSCIIHRYPDRILFLTTKFCSVNCRFCTRSRIVGEHQSFNCGTTEWESAFNYIQNHTEIRDVLISGGDPLTLNDDQLEYFLANIRNIQHVEIIRIGTKIPAVLPQRITHKLCNIIKKYHPVYMSLHFTHPLELTKETSKACCMLADAGIPLGSQTVLLKGINDNPEIMKKLFTGLLKIRVRPYYLYIADKISGTKHFRTSIEVGIDIINSLRGFISGYAIPQLIIDSPNGGGKIAILPNPIVQIKDNTWYLKNYKGEIIKYTNEK